MPNDLPGLLPFSLYNNWEKYLDALYDIYINELVNSGLKYAGLPIRYRFIPTTDGKGYGFWHLISEGENENDRIPALDRCERIRWIKWMIIESENNPDILCFESIRNSSKNIVIWDTTIHYVVILSRRNNYFLLLSAYPVTSSRERSFRKNWENYQKKG